MTRKESKESHTHRKRRRSKVIIILLLVVAVVIVTFFVVLHNSFLKSQKESENKAVLNYYEDRLLESIEESTVTENRWNKKVTFIDGEVRYLHVICDVIIQDGLQCKVTEFQGY